MSEANIKPANGPSEEISNQHDTALLDRLGVELHSELEPTILYKKIVDAAVAIMGSQFATMQLLYPEPGSFGKLRIVAAHGFTPEAEEYWEWVYHYTDSSCGEVLRTRRRVIVPDYRTAEFMQNSPTLSVFIDGGVYAAQSTPVYSEAGKLLGMVSTHWAYPHTPSQHQLDMLDILVSQAAGLIERTTTR
ncbi:GAF domain-containing protein [Polluticoccus soli]|uniref:GAF domain-containing protein n=1 Tax=Polluticoccus soli TaxID=3034150 RepID=UPI0023E114B6|nr:GAF domain-containing protein [Flavipsychrobacter sp. JY13-12]